MLLIVGYFASYNYFHEWRRLLGPFKLLDTGFDIADFPFTPKRNHNAVEAGIHLQQHRGQVIIENACGRLKCI